MMRTGLVGHGAAWLHATGAAAAHRARIRNLSRDVMAGVSTMLPRQRTLTRPGKARSEPADLQLPELHDAARVLEADDAIDDARFFGHGRLLAIEHHFHVAAL